MSMPPRGICEKIWNVSGLGTRIERDSGEESELTECLDERLAGARVVQDGELHDHLIGELIELLAGGDGYEQRSSAFLHGELRDAHGVVDRVYAATQIHTPHGDQATPEALLEEGTAQGEERGKPEVGTAL